MSAMNPILIPLIACAALAACAMDQRPAPSRTVAAPAPLQGQELDAAVYLALVTGNTLEGTSSTTGPFALHVREDLSLSLVFWVFGVERRIGGRLDVVEGRPCAPWPGVRGGAIRCSRIFKDGEMLHAVSADDGVWNASYRVVPGNPRGL